MRRGQSPWRGLAGPDRFTTAAAIALAAPQAGYRPYEAPRVEYADGSSPEGEGGVDAHWLRTM